MSANEFKDKDELSALNDKQSKKKEKKQKKERKPSQTGRIIVRIMNGEFLSRDNFITNLPFTFFIAFMLVIMIGWGYYSETVSKEEIQLERELGELDAEFFTLSSEYNARIGRPQIARSLEGTGVRESLKSPRKIKVKRFVFDE